ncbi:DUF4148 domain-containing protein [Methylorubrum populi]
MSGVPSLVSDKLTLHLPHVARPRLHFQTVVMTVSHAVRVIAPRRIAFRGIALAMPVLAMSACLGGCSSDVNPLKSAFVDAGYGPKRVDAPDFVAKSRKGDADYMPVGESAPRRAIRARNAAGQSALEAELEGARSRNEVKGRAAEGAAKDAAKGLTPNPVQ